MTAPQELRTKRLLLRSLSSADLDRLRQLAGAREVAATTLRIPHPYTEADARSFLAWAEENYRGGTAVVFGICDGSGQELRGAIGLHVEAAHARAELGYWIGVPYWGHGYCTEAARAIVDYGFDALQLNRIYATYFRGNLASQRVLQKLGMRYEGCWRQHVRKWNEFVDLEQYGLLAGERSALPQQIRRRADGEKAEGQRA